MTEPNHRHKEMKYVVVMTAHGEQAIIFPTDIVHCLVYDPTQVISAGRFTLTKYGIVHDVYDNATSFNTVIGKTLVPRPEDRDVINKTLHFGPWDYGLTQDQVEDIPGLKGIFDG